MLYSSEETDPNYAFGLDAHYQITSELALESYYRYANKSFAVYEDGGIANEMGLRAEYNLLDLVNFNLDYQYADFTVANAAADPRY